MPTKVDKYIHYAVAVRDPSGLHLFCDVARDRNAGDVYVNFHQNYIPDSKIHSSHHASGKTHHKSYGLESKVHSRWRQKPDATFQGTENLITTTISMADVRAINETCDPAKFDHVCEIPVANLRPELPIVTPGRQCMISVDLAEPGKPPIVTQGSKVVQEASFQDANPWILITLFDLRP